MSTNYRISTGVDDCPYFSRAGGSSSVAPALAGPLIVKF